MLTINVVMFVQTDGQEVEVEIEMEAILVIQIGVISKKNHHFLNLKLYVGETIHITALQTDVSLMILKPHLVMFQELQEVVWAASS